MTARLLKLSGLIIAYLFFHTSVRVNADIQECTKKPARHPYFDDEISARNAVESPEKLWPGGIVPYTLDKRFSAKYKAMIKSAIDRFDKNTCITFRKRNDQDKDYLAIVKSKRHCKSLVGRKQSRQVMRLAPQCIQNGGGAILHELMHVIGFSHEHSRPDRDNCVRIEKSCIQEGKEKNFNKKENSKTYFPYDYNSIMHYSAYASSKDPDKKTIIATQPGAENMGQRNGLSVLDIRKIRALYKCKPLSFAELFHDIHNVIYDHIPKTLELLGMEPRYRNLCEASAFPF